MTASVTKRSREAVKAEFDLNLATVSSRLSRIIFSSKLRFSQVTICLLDKTLLASCGARAKASARRLTWLYFSSLNVNGREAFCCTRGWSTVNLGLDPAAAPTDLPIEEIRKILAEMPARLLLWPSEPNEELRACLSRELSIESVVFSTCAMRPAPNGADYLVAMRANITRLADALGK